MQTLIETTFTKSLYTSLQNICTVFGCSDALIAQQHLVTQTSFWVVSMFLAHKKISKNIFVINVYNIILKLGKAFWNFCTIFEKNKISFGFQPILNTPTDSLCLTSPPQILFWNSAVAFSLLVCFRNKLKHTASHYNVSCLIQHFMFYLLPSITCLTKPLCFYRLGTEWLQAFFL